MKTYILKPTMTLNTVKTLAPSNKPLVTPKKAPANPLPQRQPLPAPVLHSDKPSLKLGLDTHLEFGIAVVQRDHAALQAPRKFTPAQLILQVQKWVAEGLVVYAVAESCGFGFRAPSPVGGSGRAEFFDHAHRA